MGTERVVKRQDSSSRETRADEMVAVTVTGQREGDFGDKSDGVNVLRL